MTRITTTTPTITDSHGVTYRIVATGSGLHIERAYPSASGGIHYLELAASVEATLYGPESVQCPTYQALRAQAIDVIEADRRATSSLLALSA